MLSLWCSNSQLIRLINFWNFEANYMSNQFKNRC